MDEINRDPRLLRYIANSSLLADEPFTLMDVGCALGLDPVWREFGDHLRAYGFDPQADECERLAREETNPRIRYFAHFIGLPDDHPFIQKQKNDRTHGSPYYNPFERSSALAALRRKTSPASSDLDAARNATEKWKTANLQAEKVRLTDFVHRHQVGNVDFIKIDTDGADLEVALSSEEIMRSSGVLGYMIETPFHGSYTETANSIHNIDRFMKSHGYMLYGMTQYRYSRAALPAPFVYRAPYQTISGQPMWGDFIYLRDGAAEDSLGIGPTALTPRKLLKLACLYELFMIPDCAAELIVKFRHTMAGIVDPDILLDCLTPPLNGHKVSYAEYVAAFERSFEEFYPGPVGVESPAEDARELLRQLEVEKAQREHLTGEARRLRAQLQADVAELDTVRREIEQMRSTRIWRMGTAYWRANYRLKQLLRTKRWLRD